MDFPPPTHAVLVALACVAVTACLVWLQNRFLGVKAARRCTDKELLANVPGVMARYDLAQGFLPSSCLDRLPPQFDAWENIVSDLARLNRTSTLRDAVDAMADEVSARDVSAASPAELRRMYLILGMLAHSYAHGGEVPWRLLRGDRGDESRAHDQAAAGDGLSGLDRVAAAAAAAGTTEPTGPPALPPQLARPWFWVCRALQMPPVLTAGATDLWNWRLRDASVRMTFDNLELTSTLTGTATEANFHLVPCAMQAAAAEVVPKVFLADLLVRRGRARALAALLLELTDVLAQFKAIFGRVKGAVDRDTFYDVYRPLLNGFYPGGIVLHGVSTEAAEGAFKSSLLGIEVVDTAGPSSSAAFKGADPADPASPADPADPADPAVSVSVCVRSKGPSAGQSTMIMLFDLLLGVTHSDAGARFQAEMLSYMPQPHRQMVLDFKRKWKPLPQHTDGGSAAAGAGADSAGGAAGSAGSAGVPSVREFVLARPRDRALAAAFEGCVRALHDLRRFHLATVAGYLERTSTGTGASTWRLLLEDMLRSTVSPAPTVAACPAAAGRATATPGAAGGCPMTR